MDHVNNYMDQLLDLKMQKLRTKDQNKQEIVQIIREQIHLILLQRNEDELVDRKINLNDLNEDEIYRLALVVQKHLTDINWQQKLSDEQLQQIRELIAQQLVVNNRQLHIEIVEKLDVKTFLQQLLNQPLLAEFIDGRIARSSVTKDQQSLYDMKDDMAFMKLSLADKLSENAGLKESIAKLQVVQDEILQKLRKHELFMDERFSTLLSDIEHRFAELQDNHLVLLNRQVKLVLVDIFGYKSESDLEDGDFEAWVRNTFVAKDYLEERLKSVQNITIGVLRSELDHTAAILMRDISERLKKDTLVLIQTKYEEHLDSRDVKKSDEVLSEQQVRKIVSSVLAIYDADKTGLADYALESAGGQVLSTRCTESYQVKSAQISIFGIPLWYPSNTPRVVISPNVQPGNCWAFQGFPGHLVLKLNSKVFVTAFTMEHIPQNLSPSGNIQSAPRNFSVWGLEIEKDPEPVLFGEYEYEDNKEALQYFLVQNKAVLRPYNIVELRIETNHGNPLYTCLYRFRVHGKPMEIA